MNKRISVIFVTVVLVLATTAMTFAEGVRHKYVSPKADGSDNTVVRPSNWNDTHAIDNGTISPQVLKATGTPDNTMVPYWDNGSFFRWRAVVGGSGAPAGSSGQLQYNDNGAVGALAGAGYNKNDNSTAFPGSVTTTAGDGSRGEWFQPNAVLPTQDNGVFLFDHRFYTVTGGSYGVLGVFYVPFTDNLNVQDASRFVSYFGNSGSVAFNSNGAVLTTSANADQAMLVYKFPLTKDSRLISIDWKTTGDNYYIAYISQRDEAPDLLSYTDNEYRVFFSPNYSAGHTVYYKNTSDVDTILWSGAGGTFTAGTVYRLVLETTPTQLRVRHYQTNGTEIATTNWLQWTAVKDTGKPLWLIIATDPYTGSMANTTTIPRVRFR